MTAFFIGCGNKNTGDSTGPSGQIDPTVNWPAGLQASFGDTLSDITLPGNGTGTAGAFTWVTPGNNVGNVGLQSHSMRFTPNDTATYNIKTQNVQLEVSWVSMVWVEAGTFTMGKDIWGGYHEVDVTFTNGFYMGKYLVTQGLYEEVMGENPSCFTAANDRPPETGETDAKRPVEMVNWYHAIAFCNRLSILEGLTPVYSIVGISNTNADAWLHSEVPLSCDTAWNAVTAEWSENGYRLPTDAQWEFAAKGGNKSMGYKYSGSNNANEVAWYSDNSGGKTREVGNKAPNELGIYDMSGNVSEWCWDLYNIYPECAQTDYTGPNTGKFGYDIRVIRGGSWDLPIDFMESVSRTYTDPADHTTYIGFRLVRR